MFLHVSKALFFSGLLTWAAFHLTGSETFAAMVGFGLFALRFANVTPFATSAVPVLLGAFVLAQLIIGEIPVREAMGMIHSRLQGVSVALAAPLDR
jgi:hypothetical protein